MTASHARLARNLKYIFQEEKLCVQALTHCSYGIPHNERLEFLGDAVLNLIIAQILYAQFPKAEEGVLTRLRAHLVKGDTLTQIALELELPDFLFLGEGERKSGGFRRASILADTLEALLGAIYSEAGLEQATLCIKAWYAIRLAELSLEKTSKDPKTQLQEWLQARQCALPQYTVLMVEGQAHDQLFKIQCEVESMPEITIGIGKSRRFAEQAAAEQYLAWLLEHE